MIELNLDYFLKGRSFSEKLHDVSLLELECMTEHVGELELGSRISSIAPFQPTID